jgi:hypothetical protein
MTGFQLASEWLDYAGTVGLELRSPLFDHESIPGLLSYPIGFSDTPRNRRLLGFPAVRARRGGPPAPLAVDFYVGGALWRRGLLQYQGFDSEKGEYSYQFQADADALGNLLQDVLLSQLALGRLPTSTQAETDDYVLAPVRNADFYDKEKNPAWCQVVNYYAPGGGGAASNQAGDAHPFALVPMLKLVPLLQRILAVYGYELGGEWILDTEVQQLVVYNLAALDQATDAAPDSGFNIADALPDVRVAELLLVLQQVFALGFVFHPLRKQVRVVALRDVVAGRAYRDRPGVANSFHETANTGKGYTLNFTADSDDDLLKAGGWQPLVLGAGAETIQPAVDTLRMVREADPRLPSRSWLVPAAAQPGRSARTAFEQTDKRSSQLRLLFYRGLRPDSNGVVYPLLSSGTLDYAGATVGQYALAWDGPQGLYQQWHKPWLDFRAAARQEERDVQLTLGEFLALDPTVPDRVRGLDFLWESVSVTVGGDQTLGPAAFTYHQRSA